MHMGWVVAGMADAHVTDKLLAEVMSLIEQDINHIKDMVKVGKLDHDAATDLTRYCKVLQDVSADREDQEEAERKKLKGMSTADLVKKAREALGNIEQGLEGPKS